MTKICDLSKYSREVLKKAHFKEARKDVAGLFSDDDGTYNGEYLDINETQWIPSSMGGCAGLFIYTPLHHAAAMGDLRLVAELLRRGAEINKIDEHDRTPIAWATEYGRHSVVEHLILKGANLGGAKEVLEEKKPCHSFLTLPLWSTYQRKVEGREVDYKKVKDLLDTDQIEGNKPIQDISSTRIRHQ